MWGAKVGTEPPADKAAAKAAGDAGPAADAAKATSVASSFVRLREQAAADTAARPQHAASSKEALLSARKTAATILDAKSLLSELSAHQRQNLVKEVYRFNSTSAAQERRPARRARKQGRRTVSLRGVRAHSGWQREAQAPPAAAAAAANASALPANFDWREVLAGMVPFKQDPLGEQIDQGQCGSCYAFAAVLMLQMRFRAQLFRQHGLLYPLELSFKSPARCSPYTEGCDGGFSYFTSRLASEVGVPLAECDAGLPAADVEKTCDWSCYKNNTNLFYAKDYWHIGGFSHGSDELSIMREIYLNGPVELGFSTSAVPEFVVLSGMSNYDETDVMTLMKNEEVLREPFSSNVAIGHWTYSTHAILAVGWGEDVVSWGMVKYWTVRNSWGRNWGKEGYAKMRRGNNDGGIEADASMVVPDLDRLPSGFLEQAKAFHDSKAADREKWIAEAKSAKESGIPGHYTGGLSDYCKKRPDSIDCK
eukprot:TRINITY_DN16410_c0_g1_i2.p1 TRINITY_DN16410_c0_g1~~TRINITY_DN16410_c0_g1_i2.p1  ORF type:complete len:479 (+),score=138.70 TRINITY_DN16410_c0_g1_i2:744-2180(+)